MTKYRLPAEWEKQAGVIFAWPDNPLLWQDRREQALAQLASIIDAASKLAPVKLLCPKRRQSEALEILNNNNTEIIDIETNDVWMRDCGPISIKDQNNKVLFSDWQFNAWGNKFPFQKDNVIPSKLAELWQYPNLSSNIILEGGAIDSNGRGYLLTTEDVLLNPNRNLGMTKNDYLKVFEDFFATEEIIWLKNGLHNDDTDGHIDNLCRFIAEKSVAASTAPQEHPDHKVLAENLQRLRNFTFVDGNVLDILELPLPASVRNADGHHLPASYSNFLILNDGILLPTYNCPEDRIAERKIQNFFPEKRVIPLDCSVIIHEGGAIHCLSQGIPG